MKATTTVTSMKVVHEKRKFPKPRRCCEQNPERRKKKKKKMKTRKKMYAVRGICENLETGGKESVVSALRHYPSCDFGPTSKSKRKRTRYLKPLALLHLLKK